MLRVKNIKISILKYSDDNIKKKIVKKLNIDLNDLFGFKLLKKSIDARIKSNILYVLEVLVDVKNEGKIRKDKDILEYKNTKYNILKYCKSNKRVIVVGSGPAGLFSAYLLALSGLKPIIIERGKEIDERFKDVNRFWQENILNEEDNVLFGEGGAGTFSDGKLNTGVNDKCYRNRFVLETFVKFGAPEDILFLQNPHIGTDNLCACVKNMRNYIISLGGEFKFSTCLTDILIKNNKLDKIIVNQEEEIECDSLILAIGHSARDTFKLLDNVGIEMKSKPFAIGVRVMHKKALINKAMYGSFSDFLPSASYKLTYKSKDNRGVYSFCMCPGGYVVNASNKLGELSINGMSNYKRDANYSNSAIVVTVNENDYGLSLFDGVEFQKKLERKAYLVGEGFIPCMRYSDYKKGEVLETVKNLDICGSYKNANVNLIFPEFINEDIKEAIEYFGTKLIGFNNDDAIILGVESRTSSPIRILRNDKFVSNIEGVYPAGEGAGYAGGIMTSAMDGMKVAEAIIRTTFDR